MKRITNILVLLLFSLVFASCQDSKQLDLVSKDDLENADINTRVIYGDDNRVDLYAAPDYWKSKSDSTVALMKATNLVDLGNGKAKVGGANFGEAYGLCTAEPFREQRSAAFCSGSLVAPDIVMSAGHCLRTANDCNNVRFVFGFALKKEGSQPDEVSTSEIYGCKEIIKTEENSNGADFSLVRLNRPVTGHEPLPLRRQGAPAVGDNLVVIGHPAGIPSKVSGGAKVRTVKDAYVVANLDTYGGNSGSAVFNLESGLIEGILVRGETDFVFKNGCRISNVCPNEGCRGEDVTRVDRVLPYLGEVQTPPPAPPQNGLTTYNVDAKLSIPDNNSFGVSSSVNADESPNGRKVLVRVEVQHTWRGDLLVQLLDPSGKIYVLQSKSGGGNQNLVGTFGENLSSKDSLVPLQSVRQAGQWTLKVSDLLSRDTGTLRSWSLIFK